MWIGEDGTPKTASRGGVPNPTNQDASTHVLRLTGFYRMVIPDIAEIASPLTDFTMNSAPNYVVWSVE